MDNENTITTETEQNENKGAAGGAETAEQKLYTPEEVAALLQSETDKRVTQALKTAEKKHQKALTLANLDGAEREKAEKDNRIAELEEQLAAFHVEKNRSELKSVLASRGLSAEFADLIEISDDIAASQAKIDKLDKLFKCAVKAEVDKRLAGSAPKTGASAAEPTKETAKKMSLAEITELERTNPELYNKLFN
jgi:hypothetical protein